MSSTTEFVTLNKPVIPSAARNLLSSTATRFFQRTTITALKHGPRNTGHEPRPTTGEHHAR